MTVGSHALTLLWVCGALSLATPSEGATLESYFYSHGKRHTIVIDKANVAVVANPSNIRKVKAKVSATVGKRLYMLGAALIPANQIAVTDRVLGLKFHFGDHPDAIGILTGEVVAKTASDTAFNRLRRNKNIKSFRSLPFGKNLVLMTFHDPIKALTESRALSQSRDFAYAHPNFLIPKDYRKVLPKRRAPADEPHYTYQWHLTNDGRWGGSIGADINANPAWLITRGDRNIKIAVLDGGFEMNHPDLETAWAVNPDEIAGNNKDDDNNGYVDDVHGWNFYDNSNTPGTGLYSDHGTAVAGLAGARVNGAGMAGVCPECSIIPVVAAWRPSDDAAAFYYAKSRGAQVITNSWGYPVGTPTTEVVEEAISAAATDSVILFAMNNINQNDCIGNSPDISSLDSVIAVSASSDEDLKVSFSAWGECMEFVSPSFESKRPGIATTDLMGNRGYNNGRREGDMEDLDYTKTFSGTSAATPIAAGVVGLMLSANRDLKRDDAIALIITTTDKVHPDKAQYDPNSGFSHKYGYGRINAGKAVRAAQVFRKYTKKKPGKPSPL